MTVADFVKTNRKTPAVAMVTFGKQTAVQMHAIMSKGCKT